MQLTPTIAVHMTAALGALVLGPVALWARRGAQQRPRLHRAAGYAWVTLMIVAAVSALFIRDFRLPNVLGYTPIHLLIPITHRSCPRDRAQKENRDRKEDAKRGGHPFALSAKHWDQKPGNARQRHSSFSDNPRR